MSEEGRDVSVLGVIDGCSREDRERCAISFPGRIRTFVVAGSGIARLVLPRRAGLPVPNLQPGERWALLVRLKRPHDGVNPGGSDRTLRMLEEGQEQADMCARRPPTGVSMRPQRVRPRW